MEEKFAITKSYKRKDAFGEINERIVTYEIETIKKLSDEFQEELIKLVIKYA